MRYLPGSKQHSNKQIQKQQIVLARPPARPARARGTTVRGASPPKVQSGLGGSYFLARVLGSSAPGGNSRGPGLGTFI